MYDVTWRSIQEHKIPQWLKDCKFGIYTHWGVYSVPACGPNATWYGYNMYREGSLQNLYHRLNFGEVQKFGYQDFTPRFTAKKFDPDEWAELFKRSGAGFAGPVGEHHEGFSMWKTNYNNWNSYNCGPKRDVAGELAKSIRSQNLKFMLAMHHAETWYFYQHWKQRSDVPDPNPYQANHEELWPVMERPSKQFLDTWLNKLKELTDLYEPDLFWFDFGLKYIQECYKKEFVSYYYNKAESLGKEFAITYKWHNLVPGSGIEDLEQGNRRDLSYHYWVTDTTADGGEAWGYLYNNTYKSPKTLIHYLIDNVSKNGALILSIGPRADGTIPEEAQHILLEIGGWLEVNGEAIYGTTPWIIYGEGPTKMLQEGPFSERNQLEYTGKDIRYTLKDDALYAICLGSPGHELLLESVVPYLYEWEIESVHMLGNACSLNWNMDKRRMAIAIPDGVPRGNYACSIKIKRKTSFKQSIGEMKKDGK